MVIISLVLVLSQNDFADASQNKIKWQVVYLSDKPGCGPNHHYYKNLYAEITKEYMDLYEFKNSKSRPKCIPETKYESDYTPSKDLDLLILVYEDDLARRELHSNNIGGMYFHEGANATKNNAIVICGGGECATTNTGYSESAWLLSHELSHFILSHLGYPADVAERKIHEQDLIHDKCLQRNTYYKSICKEQESKVYIKQSSYSYTVMKPYGPAIGNKFYNKSILYNNDKIILTEPPFGENESKIDIKKSIPTELKPVLNRIQSKMRLTQ